MTLLYRLKDRFLLMLAIAVAVYLVMVLRADGERLVEAFEVFSLQDLGIALGLVCAGYVFRFLKWEYCLRRLDIKAPTGTSIRIFISGIAMTITPGKVGEVLKSYLLKESQGVPMAVSSPVIFAERLADLFAVMLLALSGLLFYQLDPTQAVGGLAGCVAVIMLVSYRPLAEGILGLLKRLPLIGKFSRQLLEFYEASYRLLRPWPLLVNTTLSVIGWGCECVALFVTVQGFGFLAMPLARAFFIFSTGTLAGVVSPGGLGLTDGVMVTLLEAEGMTPAVASGVTLIIRACTLWFGVAIGCVMLVVGKVKAEAIDTPQ